MRHNRKPLIIALAFALAGLAVLLLSFNKGTPASAENGNDDEMEMPYDTTPTLPAKPRPYPVVGWGEVAHSKDGTATLRGISGTEGQLGPDFLKVTFELCAVEDYALPDTGFVDELNVYLQTKDAHYQPSTSVLTIDNTPTVPRMMEGGLLQQTLPKGTCTGVYLEILKVQADESYLGFSTFDGSSSSMDVDGELTRVIPSEATTYYNYD